MKRFLLLLLFIPIVSFSQETLEQELDSVSTVEEAKTFAKTHKKKTQSKVFTFNKEKHKTRLADDLFKLSKGGKRVVKTDYKKTYYKIIDKSKVLHYRASFIYFDGSKMTLEEINNKRSKIIAQYNEGYKFEALAKLHSMDISSMQGGDSGWFPEGQMHPEFEESIKNHETNDVFTLDITDRKWYYVILKTYDDKPIEEITVLKYSESVD